MFLNNETTSKFYPNTKNLMVLTDAGWRPFAGVALMGHKVLIRVNFTDGTKIEVTEGHQFFTPMLDDIKCGDLIVGSELYGRTKDFVVESIEQLPPSDVYDLIEVADGRRYFTNGVLSHNCEFISSDALLIASQVIQTIEKLSKTFESEATIINDFTFWETVKDGETYLITIDPSTGSGKDFSVINCVHFPSLRQVAEYRSNTMSSPEIYKKLKWLINILERVGSQCYFTIENNGVGEGVLALYMNDENPPAFAEMVSDGAGGSNRLGVNTNGKTKIRSCVGFKEMTETGKLTIKSQMAVTELKSFVRRKGSYEAQEGSTDDCVSSWLLVIRILEEISSYEQDAFDKLYNYDEQSYNDTTEYDENDPDQAPASFIF